MKGDFREAMLYKNTSGIKREIWFSSSRREKWLDYSVQEKLRTHLTTLMSSHDFHLIRHMFFLEQNKSWYYLDISKATASQFGVVIIISHGVGESTWIPPPASARGYILDPWGYFVCAAGSSGSWAAPRMGQRFAGLDLEMHMLWKQKKSKSCIPNATSPSRG